MIMLSLRFSGFILAGLMSAHAAIAEPFPRGCESSGYGFQGPFVTFNDSGLQKYFLIQNRSMTTIELERVSTETSFMNPKLQSKIGPGQWAAFASDISNTHFRCIQRQDGDMIALECRNVLQICQYPRVKFAISNMGSYWVATNKGLQQVISESTAKGIYLKW
jgi:hypothetical protein